MISEARSALRQRSEYTHKPNLKTGRHGWLRLTPAYSVKMVEDLMDANDGRRVLDPFCGSATTALSAAYHGRESVTIDINPFLVWLGRTKTACYSAGALAGVQLAGKAALELVRQERVCLASPPPIHRIERWWPEDTIRFLCHLRAAIEEVSDGGSPERDLLYVAFCRTVIELSAAAFNHQSMSFKDTSQASLALGKELPTTFHDNLAFVMNGARDNPTGNAHVLIEDARCLASLPGHFDLVITSPPYANRMSYIRELRPYMYWLGFLESGREAGELDWQAIGGTWGVATSRLNDWQAHRDSFSTPDFQTTLDRIAHADNKNGELLSSYVAKYIEDMWNHFRALRSKLAPNAAMHYIVGNSTFYGVLLSVEELYAEMLRDLGYTNVTVRPIRKRNSKKELVEFDVAAHWPA